MMPIYHNLRTFNLKRSLNSRPQLQNKNIFLKSNSKLYLCARFLISIFIFFLLYCSNGCRWWSTKQGNSFPYVYFNLIFLPCNKLCQFHQFFKCHVILCQLPHPQCFQNSCYFMSAAPPQIDVNADVATTSFILTNPFKFDLLFLFINQTFSSHFQLLAAMDVSDEVWNNITHLH